MSKHVSSKPDLEGGSLPLTKTLVRDAEPRAKPYELYDSRLPGLYLRVQPYGAQVAGGRRRGGKKSWCLKYRHPVTGKRTTLTVADARMITHPDKARELAKAALAEVLTSKETPVAARRRARETHEAARHAKRRAKTRTLRLFLEKEYTPKYLDHQRSGTATAKRIEAAWVDLLDRDMATLTTKDIDRAKAERLKKVTPQTSNRDWNSLSRLLNQAVAWGKLDANPLAGVKRVEVEQDRRTRYLGQHDEHEDYDQGERERFMAALDSPKTPAYLRVMTLLALNTGLRRGEIFGLTWRLVDLTRRQLTVTATTAKTARQRHVPLNKTITAVLQAWRDAGQGEKGGGLVFVNPETDKAYTTVKKAWASLVRQAEVTDFTFHDCRHDFASRLVMAGVDLYRVKELLGHSSIELTQRYAHLAPEHLADAVEVL